MQPQLRKSGACVIMIKQGATADKHSLICCA